MLSFLLATELIIPARNIGELRTPGTHGGASQVLSESSATRTLVALLAITHFMLNHKFIISIMNNTRYTNIKTNLNLKLIKSRKIQ